MIIWFTGKPCSGKTTIAKALDKELDNIWMRLAGVPRMCHLLDGDTLRGSDFSKGIGFSPEERETHLLRVGYMAKQLNTYVPYVLCSFVSPFESTRQKLPIDLLVYVKASSEECARRDVKGMWAKAKAGEIKGFTGYDAPYEEPEDPDLIIDTEKCTVKEAVNTVLEAVKNYKGF